MVQFSLGLSSTNLLYSGTIQGHINSSGHVYNTVPRGSDFHDGRSQLNHMTNETEGPSISQMTGARASPLSHSRPHEYVNYSKVQPEFYEKGDSFVSASVLTESTARRSSSGSRQPDRRNKDRRPLSPVYVNAPARPGAGGNEIETPSELVQDSSTWRARRQSSGRRQPPRGGVPVFGGPMVSSQDSRDNQNATPIPRSRNRQEYFPEELESEQPSDDMVDVNYYTSEESHTERPDSHVKNRPANQIVSFMHSFYVSIT